MERGSRSVWLILLRHRVRSKPSCEQDDELLAGEDQCEIAEFLAVPDGTEKQPDEERKEAEGAEKDLERQRADGPPEDEPEAAHQRGERIRDSLAQSRARVEDDEPDISGHEEEGAESEKQKPGGLPLVPELVGLVER